MEDRKPETACERCSSNIEGLEYPNWAAAYLRVSKPRVYQLCRQGLLPHTKLGRHYRFSPGQVIAWAESGGKSYPGGWRKEPVE